MNFGAYLTMSSKQKTYDIPRSEMIQIHDSEDFMQFLESKGYSCERNIFEKIEKVKPTQKDADLDKIEEIMRRSEVSPIILSSNNRVYDGHHRYFAKKMSNEKEILAHRANVSIKNLHKLAKEYAHEVP